MTKTNQRNVRFNIRRETAKSKRCCMEQMAEEEKHQNQEVARNDDMQIHRGRN